jgi:hypothetical protein
VLEVVRIGLDWSDQVLERRSILQCHLTKMENMEFLKAMLAKMNTTHEKIVASQERMDANTKARKGERKKRQNQRRHERQ